MGKNDYRNLLKETIAQLQRYEKTPDNVRWVGRNDGTFVCTWAAFAHVADVEYDAGFGGVEVSLNLVIVGDDWWFEREEYDGNEWWVYKTMPKARSAIERITWEQVFSGYAGF